MKRLIRTTVDILTILVFMVLCMMFSSVWIKSWNVNQIALPLHYLIAPFIELILFFWGFRFLKKRVFHDQFTSVFFPPKFRLRYFGYALGLMALCGVGILIIGGDLVYPKMDNYLFAQNIATDVGAILIAPLIEETVFRVVILTQVAKRYGVTTGIVVSSLLFGAIHLLNGELNFSSAIQLVVSVMLMGVVLSVVYVKENSVWADYTVHALYNGISSIIAVGISTTNDWPIQYILNTHNQLITGGEYGVDCSLVNIIAYVVVIVAVLVIVKRNGDTLTKIWQINH